MATSNPPSLNNNIGRSSPGVRYLDTTTAYDLWAEVYDTDGNFLQALDSIEMKNLLPQMISQIQSPRPWKLVDLGCGTGRNTSAMLKIPETTVVGLDASPKMLEIAKHRLRGEMAKSTDSNILRLELFDLLKYEQPPSSADQVDAVVSTLVLEHVPVAEFFKVATKMLKKDGLLLVTNMHSEMGNISQAGFIHPESGEKIRPKSYSHRLNDVILEAGRQGFEVVGEAQERSVDEAISEKLGLRAKKWIGVTVWFGMIFRKTS